METTLVVFFEKIIVYMPENSEMAKNWPFVAKIWPFVLAFNLQTPLRIFLIFGMEVLLMLLFQKIPMNGFWDLWVTHGRTDARTDVWMWIYRFHSLSREPKMALYDQNFAISEFSRHIEYGFLKENHKNKFHTKQVRLAMVPRSTS